MVSVACAAAGFIVGVISLTDQGLNFGSLVLHLSMNIKAIAVLLIGAASLVLGMAYRPLLGNSPAGKVALAMVTCAAGLFCPDLPSGKGTVLPASAVDLLGAISFTGAILLQKFHCPKAC